MKNGILMLIIACLLVAMPLSAEALGLPMGACLGFDPREIKINVQEEVVAMPSYETLAPMPYLKQEKLDTNAWNGMVAERPYNLSGKSSLNGNERWPRSCGMG